MRIIFALLCCWTAAAVSFAAQPNFTGTWKFDAKASKLEIKPPQATVIRIAHLGNSFKLTRTYSAEGKSDTATWKALIGGPATTSIQKAQRVKIRLSWEGDTLVADMVLTRAGGKQANNVVRYHLADNGRTLVADEKFRGPLLKYANLWVLRKQ
jgi:hypothetical protein